MTTTSIASWLMRILCMGAMFAYGGHSLTTEVPVAHACTCIRPAPIPVQAFEQASAVFSGRALNVVRLDRPEAAGNVRATLEVLDGQKGVATGEIVEIWTSWDGPSCGFPMYRDSVYLIYAARSQAGLLSTSRCMDTRVLVPSVTNSNPLPTLTAHQKPPSEGGTPMTGVAWQQPLSLIALAVILGGGLLGTALMFARARSRPPHH